MKHLFIILLVFIIEIVQGKYCTNFVNLPGNSQTYFTREQCYEAVKLDREELGCTGETFQYNEVAGDCGCGTDDCTLTTASPDWIIMRQSSLTLGHTCNCSVGFEGEDCEIDINECVVEPCLYDGICTETTDGTTEAPGVFHCACSNYFGYTGLVCDECEAGHGRDREGRCTECAMPQINNVTTKTAPCADQECPEGFGVTSDNWSTVGVNCEECPAGEESGAGSGVCTAIDYCDPHPCQNGGACLPQTSSYSCACPPGYSGTNCEIDTNECADIPCQNGGVCTETSDGSTLTPAVYHCECADGYTGVDCEEDINECASVPCQNGGVCAQDGIGEYSCTCVVGFQGDNCEIDIDECIVEPCHFDAICKDSSTDVSIAPGEFECDCVIEFGYTGQLCNECEPGSGRADDGRCTECSEPQFNSVITSTAPCADQECPDGFGVSSDNWNILGGNCEECPDGEESPAGLGVCSNTNECHPDPCQNGAVCSETSDGTTLTPSVYHCECAAGFYGVDCEEDINECAAAPCQHGGVCSETSDGTTLMPGVYHCDCPAGYNGTNCEEDINECDPEPCQNSAICTETSDGMTPTANSFYCLCFDGFSGVNCEIDLNECDPDPCQNSAVCTESGTNTAIPLGEYHCECAAGYTGSECQTPKPCTNDPCQNGGACLDILPSSYLCACPPGFDGINCQIDLNECDPDPCQNNGVCTESGTDDTVLPGEYNCECTDGYTGTNCNEDINECDPDPCQNSGVCTQGDPGVYHCECGVGYQGEDCEIDIDECIVEPCHFDAICKDSSTDVSIAPGEFHCDCVESFGYTGPLCNECQAGSGRDVSGLCNECKQPQINNVTTHSAPCADQECPDGFGVSSDSWNGVVSICEQCPAGEESIAGSGMCANINECSDPDPCQNSGICSETSDGITLTVGVYHCLCPIGYSGTNCEEDINECDPDPCQNGATCSETSDGMTLTPGVYHCECADGYNGTDCDQVINQCDPDPCQNEGVCTQGVPGEYTCECGVGYQGEDCEIDIDECVVEPCHFEGLCKDSRTDSSIAAGDFECECVEYFGYTGLVCDECQAGHGRDREGRCTECSEPQINNVTTKTAPCADQECPEGFGVSSDNWLTSGDNCEECIVGEFSVAGSGVCADINECDPKPCQNSGVCTESGTSVAIPLGEYQCTCGAGYSGKNCEIDDKCVPSPCADQTTVQCMQIYNMDTQSGDYWCECSPGWSGKNCTDLIDKCMYEPCQNGGLCNTVIHYSNAALNSYTCTCENGFTGVNCEIDVNECDPDPCQNNGVCTESGTDDTVLPGEYNCECVTGYEGTNCEEDTNECDPNPCQNEGVCTQGAIGEYNCQCADGFNGKNCEIDIDECDALDPCQHGSHCKESNTYSLIAAGDFECECVLDFGFTGPLCSECARGSGRDVDGKCRPCAEPQWNNVTTATAPCADQECPEGFGVSSDNWDVLGENCAECPVGSESAAGSGVCSDIDECATEPCQNGAVCTQTSDGVTALPTFYHCQCADGYTGTNCEEDINECDPDPCQNGATCSESIGEYTCECLAGFTGMTCEEDINECDPDPCQNSGLCSESGTNISVLHGEYHCECTAGYTGTICEEPINNCDPDPCQNEGACLSIPSGYQCACPPGYTGTICEIDTNGCEPEPCQNGGTCTNGIGANYTCDCLNGFEGLDCEKDVNECMLNPCLHGSICTETSDGITPTPGVFHCACSEYFGYTGFLCQECARGSGRDSWGRCRPCENPQINNVTTANTPCANQECDEGYGVVSEAWNGVVSVCQLCPFGEESPAGAHSGVCSNINECDPDPCQNGAICSETSDGMTPTLGVYHCLCQIGYEGTNCEEDINECDPDPCLNGATCTETSDGSITAVGVYHCECVDGYSGSNCEIDPNECDPDPCQNGGACLTVDDSYMCACPPGYSGTNCEIDTNECDPDPCQNGGTCTETSDGTIQAVGVYHCECPTGHSGVNCEIDTNECDPDPCLNGATCSVAGTGFYFCACQIGYYGVNCQNPITNECDPDPCQNGATCTANAVGYTCSCSVGYEGIDCEHDIHECDPNPCLNGGTCTETSDGVTPTVGVYHCECVNDYTGTNCQIDHNHNDCDSNPCQNGGACLTVDDSYMCACPPGYSGTNCENDINECQANVDICQGKVCRNTVGSYECDDCEIGYHQLAGDVECYQNECTCKNGIVSSTCLIDGTETCQSCALGFDLVGKKCVQDSRDLDDEGEWDWVLFLVVALVIVVLFAVIWPYFSGSSKATVVAAKDDEEEAQPLMSKKLELIF
jgi:hypothetical protein